MNQLTIGEYIGLGFVALVVLYIAARLISAAVFKSKQQYEQQRKNHHGT